MVTKKKEGAFSRLMKFLREVRAELKKVTWPNRKELTSYTVIVFASVFIVAVIIWIADSIFTQMLGVFIK
ncbi:MAG: preprotein translocase subunit SecE [Thermosediminibacterales bacterium]|nr:preprotein translocase subunit SecE [Thermosediminibacterales bacterium]